MSKSVDLVMSGSGVRLAAFVGALSGLHSNGYTIERTAGTSGGSIVAALIAKGWSHHGICDLMYKVEFSDFMDISPFAWFKYGLCSGNKFENFMDDTLKGCTFSELEKECRIVACNVSDSDYVVFSKENTPDMKVSEAVRMSMSIPIFFAYKKYNDEYMVDGGVANNYFIDTFDDNARPTIGFKLISEEKKVEKMTFFKYIGKVVDCMLSASEKKHVEDADWARTISINTGNISSIDFKLSREDKEWMHKQGKESAELWLKSHINE